MPGGTQAWNLSLRVDISSHDPLRDDKQQYCGKMVHAIQLCDTHELCDTILDSEGILLAPYDVPRSVH